jgi:hypothetical protein
MPTREPHILPNNNPEVTLQNAIVRHLQSVLRGSPHASFLLKNFGLDIAIFIKQNAICYQKFFELKAYVGHRNNAINVGTGGRQIDILLLPDNRLILLDASVRWILANAEKRRGEKRYAIFDCTKAKQAIIGDVARGRHNNLRVSDFNQSLITWKQLCIQIEQFVLAAP